MCKTGTSSFDVYSKLVAFHVFVLKKNDTEPASIALIFHTEMESSTERAGSATPNLSSGTASMENFDERHDEELENRELPREESSGRRMYDETSSSLVAAVAETAPEEKRRPEDRPHPGPGPGLAKMDTAVVVLGDGLPPEVVVDRCVVAGSDSDGKHTTGKGGGKEGRGKGGGREGRGKGRGREGRSKSPPSRKKNKNTVQRSGSYDDGKPDEGTPAATAVEAAARRRGSPGGSSSSSAAARFVDRLSVALDLCHSGWIGRVAKIQDAVHGCLQANHGRIVRGWGTVLALVYAVYFCFAVATGVEKARVLIGITVVVVVVGLSLLVSRLFGRRIDALICVPARGVMHSRLCMCMKW